MDEFKYDRNLKDKELLMCFVKFVEEQLLRPVVTEGKDHKDAQLVPEELLQHFQAIWGHIEEKGPFGELQSKIGRLSDDALADHGLEGASLRGKLEIIKYAWAKYRENGGARFFRKLLGFLEPLLKSILAAAGVGGAIDEIKDMLGNSVEP